MEKISEKSFTGEKVFIYILSFTLLGLLTYTVNNIISPFVIFIALSIALYPVRSNKVAKTLFNVAVFLLVIWLLKSLSNVLAPFLLSFILAYLLDPLVTRIEKFKVSRSLSIIIILLCFIGGVMLLFAFIIPPFFTQISTLIGSVPDYAGYFKNWVTNDVVNFLQKVGLPKENIESTINSSVLPKIEVFLNTVLNTIFSIFNGLGSILGQLINLIIIPILTFYTLKDFNFLKAKAKFLIPKAQKENVDDVIVKFDLILGNYLRGATIIAVINGIVITLFLTILGVKYSLVLGIISGLMTLIPYFGVFIAFGIGLIVSLLSGLSPLGLLFVPLIYFGENTIEASILFPKIVGSKVGLHPLLLIFSISLFSYFLGLIGMLIAVPVTSIIVLVIKENMSEKSE